MYYKNVFGIDCLMLLEYAYKLYKAYNEIFIFVIKHPGFKFKSYDIEKVKNNLIELGIPSKNIITKLKKNDIIENFFCYYHEGYGKNYFKIAYGMGSNEFLYKSIKKYLEQENAHYLCSSEYEKEILNNSKAKDVLGLIKFDSHYELPSKIDIPKNKPIILFIHTWDKCNDKLWKKYNSYLGNIKVGISDFKHTASVLERYLDKYTIIHKNHHCSSDISFEKFINIDCGMYDSKKLFDIADIIIADYGGSAVEAIISEKAKILYVDDDLHDKINQTSLDVMMHNIFNHTSNEDFENNFLKLIEEPLSEKELELRKEWRDKLFPYLDCGAQKYAEFIKNLDNEEW